MTGVRAAASVAVAGLLAALLQGTGLFSLLRLPVIPDLVLVVCVYLGLRYQHPGGAVAAFLLGYLTDSLSGSVPGLNAFALSTVYLAVYLLSRRLWVERSLARVALVFLAACVKVLALGLVAAVHLVGEPLVAHLLRFGLFEAAVAAAVSPAVFAFIGWERRLLGLA